MHTHLLSASFHVRSVSPSFLVANGAVVAGQITRLYNSGLERLKNEEDWARVRPAFTCDLWKSATNKEFFNLHGALGAGQSRRGAGVETASGGDLQGAGGDSICTR